MKHSLFSPLRHMAPSRINRGFWDNVASLASVRPDEEGEVPRKTVIAGQPHMLAYINPEEERMLRDAGGTGQTPTTTAYSIIHRIRLTTTTTAAPREPREPNAQE